MIFAGHRWLEQCHRESLFVSVYSLAAFVVVAVAMVVSWWLFTCCSYSNWSSPSVSFLWVCNNMTPVGLSLPSLRRLPNTQAHAPKCHAFNRDEITAISSAGQCNMLRCDVHSLCHETMTTKENERRQSASVHCGMCLLVKLRASTSVRNETKWNQPTILINLFAIV